MGRHLSRRILVYALGGGRGHAVRGSVVTRGLRAAGAEATVLVRDGEVPECLGVPHVVCSRPGSCASLRDTLAQLCQRLEVDTLVVDTFPEGLLGELEGPWVGPRRIALLRCRRDAASPRFHAAVRAMDAAVDLEPHLQWCPLELPTLGPITRLEPGCASHSSSLDILLVASDPELGAFAKRLAPRLRASGLRVRIEEDGPFPLDLQAAAPRVLVGPAGFNLTYEAQAMGIWHVALPRPRSHDDQHRRARHVAQVVRSPLAVERLLAQLHQAGAAPLRAPLHEPEDLARFILGH